MSFLLSSNAFASLQGNLSLALSFAFPIFRIPHEQIDDIEELKKIHEDLSEEQKYNLRSNTEAVAIITRFFIPSLTMTGFVLNASTLSQMPILGNEIVALGITAYTILTFYMNWEKLMSRMEDGLESGIARRALRLEKNRRANSKFKKAPQ